MKRIKKFWGLLLVLVLTVTMVMGCSKKVTETVNKDGENGKTTEDNAAKEGTGEAATDNSDITIGSVIMNTSGEWFAEVIAGQEAAAADLKVKFSIVSSDNEVSKESDNVGTFVAQGVDAIAISPLSSDASVAAVEAADAAGIPVVNWNTTVNTDVPKGFVGVSNYELGSLTGKYAADYIKKNFPDGAMHLISK